MNAVARVTVLLMLFAAGVAAAEPVPAPAPMVATRAQDLDALATRYVAISAAFTPTTRARALALIERLKPGAEQLSREQFLVAVLKVVALADNGHDVLNDEPGAWFPSARLPLRMIWFPDGWVVARAAPEVADLLGARVVAIEGHGPAALMTRLRAVWGGTDAARYWNTEWLIENAGVLHALGLAAEPDRLKLRVRLANGKLVRRTIVFLPAEQMPPGAGAVRLWSADAWPGEEERGWRAASSEVTPLYLREAARYYRLVELPEIAAVYVQFRSHLDRPGETLAAFMRTIDAGIEATHPEHLLVDLRFDTGGNIDLTRDWIRTLPARIPGRIYVLVGRYTFSAGIVAAAAIKHDGGERVSIVGEELGDRLVFWSEGRNECLPGSHYCPHATTGLWDLEKGCGEQPACYGDRYEATVGTLEPELRAPLTLSAWLAGQDPGMDAIRHDIARRGSHDVTHPR